MYTITDLQLSVARGQLEDRRRSAAARRLRTRRSRGSAAEPASSTVTPDRTPWPTFEHVLGQLGLISEQHRFADAGDDHVALRRLVAELVSVATRAGVADLPAPSRRDPAVALQRIAGVLATRTAGSGVPTDEAGRRRMQHRLDALRRATAPSWVDAARADAQVVDVPAWSATARHSSRSTAA